MQKKISSQKLLVLVIAVAMAGALAACNRSAEKSEKPATAPKGPTLLISAEDIYTVRSNTLASGPVITGSIQPERRADLRAEVSAVVLQVLKENGDIVHRGDLLMRLDATAIRDSLTSADAASRSAQQALEQAERQSQRMTTLRSSGMASTQQLEDAENRRNTAQSELEANKSRAVFARQQLQRTEVRAPFDGLVSDRKASAGDTVQIGKELVKVIDPASMRFEGLISADSIGNVKAGEQVVFRVNGYGEQDYIGRVRRVNPSANATTRQVEVIVDFIEKNQPMLAGLYAEGHVVSNSKASLTMPATSLVRDGDKASAWRIKDSAIQKVVLSLGERDNRSGEFVLKSGLSEGDNVLRHPSSALENGQKVDSATTLKPTSTAKAEK